MTIVVCGNNGDAWWEVRNKSGRTVATSFREYTRFSDAKRSAKEFEKNLWLAYVFADNDKTEDGCMIPIKG